MVTAVRSPLTSFFIVTWGPGAGWGLQRPGVEPTSALTHGGTQSFLSLCRPQFPHLFMLLKVPFVSNRPHLWFWTDPP